MKTITIASFVGFCNRGAEALLKTRIESIRKSTSGVKFYVLSIYTETCKPIKGVEYIDTFGGRREKLRSMKYLILSICKGVSWTTNALMFRLFGFCFNKDIKKIASCEIFISTDGDILGEDYGLFPLLWRIYFLSLGLIMKKPVIIFAEGLGPFKSKIGRLISKLFFNKCSYISVREKISIENLTDIGIKREKIHLVADTAFLLEPSPKNLDFRQEGKKLIGISVSKFATKYGFCFGKERNPYNGFNNYMAKLIDWMVEELNTKVIMIPHVVQIYRDDYQTAKDILDKVKNKSQVEILDRDLDASELKKAISYCDLVIASRMHAAIAALSTHVPVIGIAYSHKMIGICNSLGIIDYINIKDLDWKITNKIQEVLARHDNIDEFKVKIALTKKLAEKPSFEVARILNKGKSLATVQKDLRQNIEGNIVPAKVNSE